MTPKDNTGPTARKLRVGIDLRALVAQPTGIGFFTISVLRELSKLERFELVGLAHAPPRLGDELAKLGLSVEVETAPLGVIWQQVLLPRRLKQGDIDVFWSPLLTLPRRCPVPSVVNIHDLTPLLYPQTHRLKVRLSMLPFLSSSVKNATTIVTGSQSAASDLAKHYPRSRGKTQVIVNGVASEFKPGSRADIAATRKRLGCPDGYLLFIGTLEPRKDVATLLDAWEQLKAQGQAVPLVLIGPYGWRNRALLDRIETLAPSGLRYLGRVSQPELVAALQAARVFVYPSLYEGFGLPVAEAMACGIPTIACDTSSLPEVVGDGGELVPPGDPAALQQAIRRLLDDPEGASELATRGLQQSRKFRWSETAAQLAESFEQAALAGPQRS